MSRDCDDVACVSPELLPGRCGGGPRQGTRGCRGVSRDCGDVACVSPELFLKGATYTTATANNAAIYSRLGISTVIFQTQSMLLQASRRVFP